MPSRGAPDRRARAAAPGGADGAERPSAAPEVGAGLLGDLGLGRMLEALLFLADRPLTPGELGGVVGASEAEVRSALQQLRREYAQRGIVIVEHAGEFRMASAPEAGPFCRRLLGLDSHTRLSRAALETLAVIAYRQPATRAQIEQVRGVDSESALATLLTRGLVESISRSDAPGRPALFSTTPAFLTHFGLTALQELPTLEFAPAPDDRTSPGDAT